MVQQGCISILSSCAYSAAVFLDGYSIVLYINIILTSNIANSAVCNDVQSLIR